VVVDHRAAPLAARVTKRLKDVGSDVERMEFAGPRADQHEIAISKNPAEQFPHASGASASGEPHEKTVFDRSRERHVFDDDRNDDRLLKASFLIEERFELPRHPTRGDRPRAEEHEDAVRSGNRGVDLVRKLRARPQLALVEPQGRAVRFERGSHFADDGDVARMMRQEHLHRVAS
jgi:hypothetical protein